MVMSRQDAINCAATYFDSGDFLKDLEQKFAICCTILLYLILPKKIKKSFWSRARGYEHAEKCLSVLLWDGASKSRTRLQPLVLTDWVHAPTSGHVRLLHAFGRSAVHK